MKKKVSKIWVILTIFFLGTIFFKLTFKGKIYINITPSIKTGLYLMRDYDGISEIPKRSIVLFSPPIKTVRNREFYQDFLKIVVGNSKDEIELKDDKIYINKKYYGTLVEKDRFGNNIKTLIPGKQDLNFNEYFVMGTNENSYDSRYWGAIKSEDIKMVGKLFIPFFW